MVNRCGEGVKVAVIVGAWEGLGGWMYVGGFSRL